MLKRDLVEKYGVGPGAHEEELRTALRVRNTAFSLMGALVCTGAGALWYFAPTAFLIVMLALVIVAGIMFVGRGLIWLIEELPDHMRTIDRAKKYGVIEDKE